MVFFFFVTWIPNDAAILPIYKIEYNSEGHQNVTVFDGIKCYPPILVLSGEILF